MVKHGGGTFQHNNSLKHTAQTTLEWLQDNSLSAFEWPSQGPDLNPTEHLWRDLKMVVLSSLMELQRMWQEEWDKCPNPSLKEDSKLYSVCLELITFYIFVIYMILILRGIQLYLQNIQCIIVLVSGIDALLFEFSWYTTSTVSFEMLITLGRLDGEPHVSS